METVGKSFGEETDTDLESELKLPDIEPLVQLAQKEVLDSYRREFDYLSASFRDLDGKAQGTATVAGAFLAAGLALFNRPGGLNSCLAKPVLGFAVFGLATSIILSVLALRVHKIRSCPSGEEVGNLLNALKNLPDERIAERIVYFYGDASELWRACTGDRRSANNKKAFYISLAQVSLMVTALSIAGLILWLIAR